MFQCLECGRKFRSERAAERAYLEGCPDCGGVDIDLCPAAWRWRMQMTRERCHAQQTHTSEEEPR